MKYFYTLFITLIALNINAQSCDGRYQTEIFTNVDVTTVDYGQAGGQTLKMDIYQAQGDTAEDRPVIIFCFGGSFVAGSRDSPELVDFATDFAKRGYVCASIDYRVAASALQLLQEEAMVKVVFGAVQDGKAAIRYFRKNAIAGGNTLGIDTNQIYIGGTSAGGILGINLAYVDEVTKLPPSWQNWADEIGGIEGNSGNPGYCSAPDATFSFAGAVGDTAYIDENDVPFYSCHATGDQTVQYGFGAPLNGIAPVDLYGSGEIETRLNNLGIYNIVDTYSGSDHPPLNGNNYDTTVVHFSNFLYNILDCNPNNQKKANQQNCQSKIEPADTTNNDTTNVSIFSIETQNTITIYPNPTESILNLKSEVAIDAIQIVDLVGRVVFAENELLKKEVKLDVSTFEKGLYLLKLRIGETWFTDKIYIK